MSKIVLTMNSERPSASLISRLRQLTGLGISEIKTRIGQGLPLVEYTLFENNHDEIASRLRAMAGLASETDGQIRVFELKVNEDYADCPRDLCEISLKTMHYILDTHDDQMRDQT